MLTNKEKKYLRKLANPLSSIFQVGKEGVSSNQIKGINDYLEAHELVKIAILKNCESEPMEVALDICSSTKSELVQIIGKIIILYRPSKKKIINLKEANK